MLTSLTALGGCFVSCDDDDDKGGSSPSVETYEIGKTGRLLTSVGSDRWFRYDTQGQLTEFYDGDFTWSVKNNPLSMTVSDAYYDEDAYEELKWDKFSFNGKGHLTSASFTSSWGDYEESGKGTGSLKCRYDGSGHLTSCTLIESGDVALDEGKVKITDKSTVSIVWSGGRITSATARWERSENGVSGVESEDISMTFAYPSEPVANPHAQPNVAFLDVISYCFDGSLEALAFINLFGVGMSELPTSFEAVIHVVGIRIHDLPRPYSPGMATALLCLLPSAVAIVVFATPDSPSAESDTRAVAPARADAPSAARHRHSSLRRHASLRRTKK